MEENCLYFEGKTKMTLQNILTPKVQLKNMYKYL